MLISYTSAEWLGSPCSELVKEFEIVELEQIPFESVLPGDHLLALRKRVALGELCFQNSHESIPVSYGCNR